jgi:hypothetical protein
VPKKSHVWEEANTKNQTKPFLRPSSAPCRAGSLESNKKLQRVLRPVNAMLLNEFLKARRQIDVQQKQIEALTVGLQKVSAQLEATKPAPQVVNNP